MNKRYQKSLLNHAALLDVYNESAVRITELAKKIIDEKDDISVKKLLTHINIFANSANLKKKRLITKLYNSLLLYLGSIRLIEISDITYFENNDDDKTVEELQLEFDKYVGLTTIKEKVKELVAFHEVQKLREKEALKNAKNTLHMAFIGNPGTGKTTVARIIGKMYKKIGLLSKGHFIEVTRTDLIAGYQGQTALKVKKVIDSAKGGVLFIDEAYSITENSNSDSYGRECLTELTKALEDFREDLVVIVAGYKEPMDQFFSSNPGLKSRFNIFIKFEDYNEQQLAEILENMCNNSDYFLSVELKNKIYKYFKEQIKNKTEHFSNGRLARNLYDDLIMNHAKRIRKDKSLTKEKLSLLEEEDFLVDSGMLSV